VQISEAATGVGEAARGEEQRRLGACAAEVGGGYGRCAAAGRRTGAIGRAPGVTGKRLLIVAGKGGVGRSMVAAAIGVSAARSGQRAIVAETAGRADVPALLGRRAVEPLVETELQPGLYHVTIDRRGAPEEYLRYETPGPVPAAVLARSRAFGLFVEAAPGMSDLLTIGKVWELGQRPRHKSHAQSHDVVVLNAPPSGELTGLLAAPRTFARLARVGPVAWQAERIDRELTNNVDVGVVIVATPEQMAVTEALGLRTALAEQFGLEVDAVLVNRVFPVRFSAEDAARLSRAPDDAAIRSARWFHRRVQAQQAQLERLRAELDSIRCIKLPFLFKAELERTDVEHLAGLLPGVGG
jgi:anion-transporting  ArsA/GET3 family ATPase